MSQQSQKLEHYILGKTIGSGSFGKVKEATHEITRTKVAIKIINKKKMIEAKICSKIKREIRLLKYFSHPNIIKLYEVLDSPNYIFVILELIQDGELFDLISRRGKLTEPESRELFIQLLNGMEYCHQHLVTHRDLKPENILLNKKNGKYILKIADFGLSNLIRDGKYLKTSCGSPNYAAPEVINGKKYQGSEVDTWSAGVILYAMVTGKLPFDEQSYQQLFQKIRKANYQMPLNISYQLKDLFQSIFQTNVLKRIKFQQLRFHP